MDCADSRDIQSNNPALKRVLRKLSRYSWAVTRSEEDLLKGIQEVVERDGDTSKDASNEVQDRPMTTDGDRSERSILQEFRTLFITYLDTPDIVDYMISHGLLSEDDSETVSVGATRKGRVRNLLRIIDSRGPCAESTFLRALQSRPEFGHVWFKIHKEKGAAAVDSKKDDEDLSNLMSLSKIYRSNLDINQLSMEAVSKESNDGDSIRSGICYSCQSPIHLDQLSLETEGQDQQLTTFPGYITTNTMTVGDIYNLPTFEKTASHIQTKTKIVNTESRQFTASWTCPVELNDVLEFLELPVGVALKIIGGERSGERGIDRYLTDVMRRPEDGHVELLILIQHKELVDDLDLDHKQSDISNIRDGSHVVYQVTWGHACLLSYRLTQQAFRRLHKISRRQPQSLGPCNMEEMLSFLDDLTSITRDGQCYMFNAGIATGYEDLFLETTDLTIFSHIPKTPIEYILKPVPDTNCPVSTWTPPYLREGLADLTELLDARRHLVTSAESNVLQEGQQHSQLLKDLDDLRIGFTRAIAFIDEPNTFCSIIKKCNNFRKSGLSVFNYTQAFITAYDKACEEVTWAIGRQSYDSPVRSIVQRGTKDLYVVLTGPNGQGKSATGNTLIGKPVFTEKRHSSSALNLRRSSRCSQSEDTYLSKVPLPDGRTLHVLDTDYLALHQRDTRHLAVVEMARAFFLFHQGIDAFADIHNSTTFFREPQMDSLLSSLEDILHHTILLLTFAETHFQGSSIREDIDTMDGDIKKKVLRRQKRVLCFENKPSKQSKVQLGSEQLSFDSELAELKRTLQSEQFVNLVDTIGEVYRNRFIDTARELYEQLERQIEKRVESESLRKAHLLAESLKLLRRCVREVGYNGSCMNVMRKNILGTQSDLLKGNNMATMCVHQNAILQRTHSLCEIENQLVPRSPVAENHQETQGRGLRQRSRSTASVKRYVERRTSLDEERIEAMVLFQCEVTELHHEYSQRIKEQLRRSYKEIKERVERHIANLNPERLNELLNTKELPWSCLQTSPKLKLEAQYLEADVIRSQLHEEFFPITDLDVQAELIYVLSLYCEQLLSLRRCIDKRPSLMTRALSRVGAWVR